MEKAWNFNWVAGKSVLSPVKWFSTSKCSPNLFVDRQGRDYSIHFVTSNSYHVFPL